MTIRNHIDSSDFIDAIIFAIAATVFSGAVVAAISLFVGPPGGSWWSVLIIAGIIGFAGGLGITLFALGRAVHDWYEYDAWRK